MRNRVSYIISHWLAPCPERQLQYPLCWACPGAQGTNLVIGFWSIQVEKLRICLEEARRRLGAQSRSLQQQWRRGITLGDTARLLGDVNSISDAPQRVQKLEEAKVRLCHIHVCGLPASIQCVSVVHKEPPSRERHAVATACPFVSLTYRE